MRHHNLLVVICFTILLFLSTINLNAQKWGDYTLYSVQNSTAAYLIDTSGNTYHTWTFATSAQTAYGTYMLPGGTLVRTVNNSNPMGNGGGMTGRVQKVDYSGNVTWDFTYSSSTYCLHHDICPLPNGNVLMISYDVKTSADATAAGCSTTMQQGIWSEKIIEVQPTGSTTGTIVWEWDLWDHLCQSYSSSKANYVTSIVDNPQLMNINYSTTQDWFHMNGLDYNPTLDQIVFSSHNMNSLFIIDHSTTTTQAKTHTGGNSGKGGDFLYRWGNPASYGATGTTDFNIVHDAHWIQTGCPKAGYIAAFNNQGGTGGKSCIDIFQPPLNEYNYNLTLGSAYTPSTYAWRTTYSGTACHDMGNSQHLPNGNVLICIAQSGYIYEIDSNQNTIWSKTISGVSPQAYRYSAAYTTSAAMTVTASANYDTVCSGNPVQLSSTATGSALQYSWVSFPSGFTSNLQNPVVSPTTSAKYVVTVYNGVLSTSDSVYIYVIASTPVISQNGDTLISNSTSGNQWYSLATGIITNATAQNYTPQQTGDYYVIVTSNGCTSDSSNIIHYNYTGISTNNPDNINIKVIPNPFTDNATFIYNLNEITNVRLSISDISGREVKVLFDNKQEKGEHKLIFNAENFTAGVYFYKIDIGNKTKAGKLIITK